MELALNFFEPESSNGVPSTNFDTKVSILPGRFLISDSDKLAI
jgi:hypothetical protein